MMEPQACCTCAAVIQPPKYQTQDEKCPASSATQFNSCCQRPICEKCLQKNPRYHHYCPYCQLSFGSSVLPREGLRLPPSYAQTPLLRASARTSNECPPSYSSVTDSSTSTDLKESEDVIHHVHQDDTIRNLGLAYKVPVDILRKHNAIWSDNLLVARRTILIPASHYEGASLSPTPIESAEEQERKTKLRRFQTQSKCYDYEVAQLYLKTWSQDVDMALQAWREDEAWEKNNPVNDTPSPQGWLGKTIQRNRGGLS